MASIEKITTSVPGSCMISCVGLPSAYRLHPETSASLCVGPSNGARQFVDACHCCLILPVSPAADTAPQLCGLDAGATWSFRLDVAVVNAHIEQVEAWMGHSLFAQVRGQRAPVRTCMQMALRVAYWVARTHVCFALECRSRWCGRRGRCGCRCGCKDKVLGEQVDMLGPPSYPCVGLGERVPADWTRWRRPAGDPGK